MNNLLKIKDSDMNKIVYIPLHGIERISNIDNFLFFTITEELINKCYCASYKCKLSKRDMKKSLLKYLEERLFKLEINLLREEEK